MDVPYSYTCAAFKYLFTVLRVRTVVGFQGANIKPWTFSFFLMHRHTTMQGKFQLSAHLSNNHSTDWNFLLYGLMLSLMMRRCKGTKVNVSGFSRPNEAKFLNIFMIKIL